MAISATRFQPGQSGNPSGRPAIIKDIQALARQHTTAAIAALVTALTDPRQRVAAATALLDRGYGKASQSIDLHHNVPLARADDAALLAIACAGGGGIVEQAEDTHEPGGVDG